MGWFGVAVAWLATVTTGAWIATSLPAHAPTHVHPSVAALTSAPVVAMPTSGALAAAPQGPLAPLSPVIAPLAATGAQVEPAAPVTGAPVAAAPAPSASIARVVSALPVPVVITRKVAPRAAASPRARVHLPAPVSASAAVSPAPLAAAPAAAPAPRPQAAPAAKSAAPAATPAGTMSLEDSHSPRSAGGAEAPLTAGMLRNRRGTKVRRGRSSPIGAPPRTGFPLGPKSLTS